MRKELLLLVAFTIVAMLLAVFAVVKYSVSTTFAFLAVVTVFAMLAGPLVWRKNSHEVSATPDKSRPGLKWLYVPFVIGALGAVFMASQEGWNVGDTVGAIFVGVFGLLIGYELLRRRKTTQSQ